MEHLTKYLLHFIERDALRLVKLQENHCLKPNLILSSAQDQTLLLDELNLLPVPLLAWKRKLNQMGDQAKTPLMKRLDDSGEWNQEL